MSEANLPSRVRDLECLCVGVDGTNGFRSRIVAVEDEVKEVRQEIRDVTNFQTKIIGAMIVIGFLAEMFIAHLWK